MVHWTFLNNDSIAILRGNIYCVDSDMTPCRIKILTWMNVLKGFQEFFKAAKYLRIQPEYLLEENQRGKKPFRISHFILCSFLLSNTWILSYTCYIIMWRIYWSSLASLFGLIRRVVLLNWSEILCQTFRVEQSVFCSMTMSNTTS